MADDPDLFPEDEREIELSSIRAIFPETVLDARDPFSASVEIAVTPATPFPISSASPVDQESPVGTLSTSLTHPDDGLGEPTDYAAARRETARADISYLAHLPPLSLRITLPEGYPDHNPPVLELTTTPSWLPPAAIQDLTRTASTLWEELGRGPVIFALIDSLQQAAEEVFGLTGGETAPLEVAPDVLRSLLDFDAQAKRAKFENESFECGICLTPRKGSACHRMWLCAHVFCIGCLQDFYNSCITEGDVASVKCLEPSCGKAQAADIESRPSETIPSRRKRQRDDRTLSAQELLEISLDQDTVRRYVELRRKALLEMDRNVIYCPRKWCQGPARWKIQGRSSGAQNGDDSDGELDQDSRSKVWKEGDPEEDMPPPSERVAVCEDCSYAFCRVCLAGWHGELTRCWPRRIAELNAEEQASADYMKAHSSPCPTCNARCQKTMGCNHMVCFKCRTHFCYLCSSWLDERNPYKHYNTPHSPCYMRLWVLEGGDGHDPPRAPHEIDDEEDEGAFWAGDAHGPQPAHAVGGGPEQGNAPGQAQAHPAAGGDDERARDQDQPDEAEDVLPPAPEPPRQEALVPPLNEIARRRARRGGPVPPPPGQHPPPAPDQRRPAQEGRRIDRQGLRRFLDMVNNDEEDEWDSDELGEDEDANTDWVIPVR